VVSCAGCSAVAEAVAGVAADEVVAVLADEVLLLQFEKIINDKSKSGTVKSIFFNFIYMVFPVIAYTPARCKIASFTRLIYLKLSTKL
jgi:hypothetical protein